MKKKFLLLINLVALLFALANQPYQASFGR